MGKVDDEMNIVWNLKREYEIPLKVYLQTLFGGWKYISVICYCQSVEIDG